MFFKKKRNPRTPTAKQPTVEKSTPELGYFDQERKQIALTESEARYRRLFETAKDGILILDGDTGRITDANPFLQDMLGYTKAELIGLALWEIGPIKNIAASQEAMHTLQNQEYIRYEDLPLETKAGERKQVEFVSNVYLVNGWKVIQCNIRDITARKQAEAQALKAQTELLALVAELQWRDQSMQSLNHLNDLLQSCVTIAEAYKVITLTVGGLFPNQNGSLAILHPKDQQFTVVAHWGPAAMIEPAFALNDCWALRRGQLHEVLDPQAGLVCTHFIQPPQSGYLCLPLTVLGETFGVLCLMDDLNNSQTGTHHSSQHQLAVNVSETIKLALSNLKLRSELQHQAVHDPLTGLYNRRFLDETLQHELHILQRRKTTLSVVMLDFDAFKKFNDTFGHGPGDTLLREFSGILHERLRKSDIACRYGGDEFVIVLPESSISDTQERTEQIRTYVNGIRQMYQDGKKVGMLTLSAGIAQAPEHGTTAAELLKAADEALYSAKQNGRNRSVIYQPTVPQ